MGIFGKKKEKQDKGMTAGTNAYFYEGELPGFAADDIVMVALTDEALTIMKPVKGKEPLTVKLDTARVIGMDVFRDEKQYMLKHHGEDAKTTKSSMLLGKAAEKNYFVIRYTAKDGTAKHLDFWCTMLDTPKVIALKNKLMKAATPDSYEI